MSENNVIKLLLYVMGTSTSSACSTSIVWLIVILLRLLNYHDTYYTIRTVYLSMDMLPDRLRLPRGRLRKTRELARCSESYFGVEANRHHSLKALGVEANIRNSSQDLWPFASASPPRPPARPT